jgi:hypothetical protein
MGPNLGTARIKVAPDMTGIQGKIASGMRGSGTQATKMLGYEINSGSGKFNGALGKLGGMAKVGGLAIASGIAAGAVGVGILATKMLKAGSQLEQQLGGSEAVFGKYAKTIQAQAETAYTKAGLSQNEFLQGANKMGSLFQGAGFKVQDSMKMSGESMQRASDIASIMGIDTTSALEAVTGMAKGNFTMMDNLGVAMNDTAIGAYAASKGINKTTSAMSIQEKVGLAQQMFMEKTAKYAGNYAKENETLAGSMNTTKKAFDNFLATGDIGGFIDSLINTIQIAIPQIVAILPKLVSGIGSVLTAIVPELAKALPVLIPALIKAVTDLLTALVKALPTIVQVLVDALPVLINAFIKIFLGIVKALPQIVTILANAMPKIIDALVNGLTNPEAIQAIILGAVYLLIAIIKAIPIIVNALVKALPVIVKNIVAVLTDPRFIAAMIRAGIELLKAVIVGIISMGRNLDQVAKNIIVSLTRMWSPSNMAKIGRDMITGLWNGVSSMAGWIRDKFAGFSQGVLDNIKGFFGIHSPSTVFAEIGHNLGQGLAEGVDSSTALVDKSIDKMANSALTAAVSPLVSPVAAAAGTGYVAPVNSRSNTTQTTHIEKVYLGDQGAVQEFFKQINQDTISVGMGMTPLQGT